MMLKKIQLDGKWFRVVGYVHGEEVTKYRSGWALYICRRGRTTVFLPMDASMQPFDIAYVRTDVKLGECRLNEELMYKVEKLSGGKISRKK